MATNPIYVETEEEIPELVERLRRYHGEDTMVVLPMRSRIGQSRFNFQLLRNYSARLGKRVTVVCDDPAVQRMASESGFPVFGAVGPQGEGVPSEAAAPPPVRKWWQRRPASATTHVGVAAPTRLLAQTASGAQARPLSPLRDRSHLDPGRAVRGRGLRAVGVGDAGRPGAAVHAEGRRDQASPARRRSR